MLDIQGFTLCDDSPLGIPYESHLYPTRRKNAKNLHTWSFYRLAQFIQYKAELAGIKVVYVNPKYTSQTCPVCGERNHAKDRKYKCPCGFKIHRDIPGAMNIITAPVTGAHGPSA